MKTRSPYRVPADFLPTVTALSSLYQAHGLDTELPKPDDEAEALQKAPFRRRLLTEWAPTGERASRHQWP